MAGEWIKFQTSTLKKPEILRIARMLGINRNEALGLMVEFWVWLDDASVDGTVDGLEASDVDAMMSCPGLSAALQDVGWLSIDAENHRISVPNFGRHNGESAKKRALKNERQARWRDKTVDAPASTKASTREEKRRVTTSSLRSDVVGSTKRPAVLESPTDEHRLAAKARGVDCDAEWQRYVDWLAANGKVHRDRAAGFRNWLGRATPPVLRAVGAKSQSDRRAEVNAAIWGVRNEPEPTDITGQSERVA